MIVVGLHPVGDQCAVGVVSLGACLEGHGAAEHDLAGRGFRCWSGCRCRCGLGLLFLDVGLAVERVAIADDGAIAAGVGVFLHAVAAVAFDRHDLTGGDLHDDAGVVGSAAAAIAEKDLIAHLGVLVTATLLLVVLHAVGAACTVGAGLTLDALAFVLAVCLEKAPVDKDVAPREAIFVAIIIARRREVAGVLCPVGGAGFAFTLLVEKLALYIALFDWDMPFISARDITRASGVPLLSSMLRVVVFDEGVIVPTSISFHGCVSS